MALNSGKILMRRGQEVNFDPNKMTPGEWAVSLDSKYVRMCFSPGVCVRMATYDAFEADMVQIQKILAECQTVEEAVQRIYEEIKDVAVDVERIETAAANALKSEQNALNSANSASQSANTAVNKANEALESANTASTKAEQATDGARIATEKASEAASSAENVRNMSNVSQSYAVGGTGTREGEDTDNSKYYNQQASDNADRAEAAAERASAVADVGVATSEKAGLVKPDGETIRVDPDGTIHADRGTTSYTDLENKPKINKVVLEGEKTLEELGIASKEALEKTDSKVNIIIEQAELRFKETASGENIHLDDSADSKLVEFALYGKAVQNGTPTPTSPIDIEVSGESYNLIPYPYSETTHTQDGIAWTVDDKGVITANGTQSGGYSDFFLISTDKPMILKAGTYIFNGCLSGGVLDKTYFMLIGSIIDGVTDRLASDVGNGATFTINKDTPIWALIRYSEAAVATNHVFKPMLRKASVKNDRYMPYGKGSVEVKSVGKNLIPYPYKYESQSFKGIDYTSNSDGSVTLSGTPTDGNSYYLLSSVTLKSGETYIITANSPNSTVGLHVRTADSSSSVISIGASSVELTVREDATYLVFVLVTDTVSDSITIYPMIRHASIEDNTWEPYKDKTATIPTENGLAGIPVNSGGNYTDSNGQQWICDEVVKYADGSGEKIQRVGIIDSYSAETITGVYMSTTGELTEGAKILYQLAKPITTSLTAEELAEIEKLSTFYSVTNISNDFDCGMKVKYIADAKSYIDNRLALIEQAMLNSI